MFHILERETQWRRENGRPEGFSTMRAFRPIVAVGAKDPLEDQKMLADYFRTFSFSSHHLRTLVTDYPADGTDGLGGIHASVWPSFLHSHPLPFYRMKNILIFYHIAPTSHS